MRSLSDSELLRRLFASLRQSRRDEVDLVTLIAEVDARKLYARQAVPSMFLYCTEVLHLSEQEAYLRITVARASREHPQLLSMLRDGLLHLSGIVRLTKHLTRENRDEVLGRAVHKTRREIEELVAELEPRPEVPPAVRKLPTRRGAAASTLSSLAEGQRGRADVVGCGAGPGGAGPDVAGPDGAGPDVAGPDVAGPRASGEVIAGGRSNGTAATPTGRLRPDGAVRPDSELCPDRVPVKPGNGSRPPATVQPVAPARYRVQFTASAELRQKLERLQALMRSSVPDGDLGRIIDSAVTEKLERLEARRFARTSAPRKTLKETDTTPTSRHVPAAVRRAVHQRDGGRCTYQDVRGRRCTARDGLEFHHHDLPFGRGGEHSVVNIRLMCRTHNQLLAELAYGRKKMARYRRGASRVSEARVVPGRGAAPSRVSREATGTGPGGGRGAPGAHSEVERGDGPSGAPRGP